MAAKRGADGVMKGQRGCLGLISALILAAAGSMFAVSVSGISHQHRKCASIQCPSTVEIPTIFGGMNDWY